MNLDKIGIEWLLSEIENITDNIERLTPVEFNEKYRYLPQSVTSSPGYIRYDLFPYLKEPLDCMDIDSDVREVSMMKGVQVGYTTFLESALLYFMAHVKTLPMMFVTVDNVIKKARLDNSIMPMINHSGFRDIIRSNDKENTRKTGQTEDILQFEGGGYMAMGSAQSGFTKQSLSILAMLKDELDKWKDSLGDDGDPDKLTDNRCSAFWEERKILRGSTPLIKANSKILKSYKKGDQRKYFVKCLKCGHSQFLRWSYTDKETGLIGGFKWETEKGTLINDSVRYDCIECGHSHYEHDKQKLFSEDNAEWIPTAKPIEEGIRSYHLPAFYSPIGFQPWYKCVASYLDAYEPETKKTKNIKDLQTFYNEVLGEPFQKLGGNIKFQSVSAHRRYEYKSGQVPNLYANKNSGSDILLLTCQVDVHKRNLAVSVMGWTKGFRCYVIDYWRLETKEGETDCTELSSTPWNKLREIIEEKVYFADNGLQYKIAITFVDAGYANDTVTSFCSDYVSNVYPILGRERPSKNQKIQEFGEFTTQQGTKGYRITVDHYKDRLAPVLRREWHEVDGIQRPYHFNAPMDLTDKAIKELTAEYLKEVEDTRGNISYIWFRPSGKENELWDLLVYGNCAVEVLAKKICIDHFGMDNIDWVKFWDYLESEKVFFN